MPSIKPTPGTLRARLRTLIEQDGRTQSEIAAAAGMSQPQLNQVLTGHRASPAAQQAGWAAVWVR